MADKKKPDFVIQYEFHFENELIAALLLNAYYHELRYHGDSDKGRQAALEKVFDLFQTFAVEVASDKADHRVAGKPPVKASPRPRKRTR